MNKRQREKQRKLALARLGRVLRWAMSQPSAAITMGGLGNGEAPWVEVTWGAE